MKVSDISLKCRLIVICVVLLVAEQIETAIALTQEKVNSDLNVAGELLSSLGTPVLDDKDLMTLEAVEQISRERQSLSIPQLKLQGKPLAYHYDFVDNVQELVGGRPQFFNASRMACSEFRQMS
jgi:hypothetical protein